MKKGLIALCLIVFITTGFGQETLRTQSDLTNRSNASRYILSATNDALLMTVKVWGEVKKPGLYDVPIGTDLVELISSAGGPTSMAKLTKIKVIHSSQKDEENYVTTIDIKEFLDTGNSKLIPEIRPNDTIVVPIKPTQYILTSLSWTQQLLSLFSAYALIQYYTSR
ncbi:MAG TPA: hypothetical protein DHW42_06275 [Candidatus Marinimicrobia bacterium]|nr:hypothetical protein [Candidatus Neomarinimicrobiota bacterium]